MTNKVNDKYSNSQYIHKQYLKGRKIVLIVLVVTLLSMSIAYAADLSAVLSVLGYATIEVDNGKVEITSVSRTTSSFVTANSHTLESKIEDDKYIATFNGNITYFKNPNNTDRMSITYQIVITNNTSKVQSLTEIRSTPTFVQGTGTLSYTTNGVTSGVTAINPGESVTVDLELYLANGVRKTTYQVQEVLEFVFVSNSASRSKARFPFNTSLVTTDVSFDDFTEIKPISIFLANNSSSEVSYNVTTTNNNFLIVDNSGNIIDNMTIPASSEKTVEIYLKINDKHLFVNDLEDVNLFLNLTGPTILTYSLDSVEVNVPVSGGNRVLGDKSIIDATNLDFASSSNSPGIYMDKGGEVTYFYHGNINNNYVSFAGLTWRIVKIDRYGTKLILDNIIDITSPWTSNTNVNTLEDAINALKYENSLVKPILDSWYQSTLSSYANTIVPTIFCQDFNYQTVTLSESNDTIYYFGSYIRGNENIPKFGCNQEYTFSNNIGLLSLDEAILAGSILKNTTTNYYLYNSVIATPYWLLSPSYYNPFLLNAGIFSINGNDGMLSDNYAINDTITSLSIRPVITINTDSISKGDGTKDNPYLVAC